MQTRSKDSLDRRSFIKGVSAMIATVPVLQLSTLSLVGCNQTSKLSAAEEKPTNVPWNTTIVADGEAGEA